MNQSIAAVQNGDLKKFLDLIRKGECLEGEFGKDEQKTSSYKFVEEHIISKFGLHLPEENQQIIFFLEENNLIGYFNTE